MCRLKLSYEITSIVSNIKCYGTNTLMVGLKCNKIRHLHLEAQTMQKVVEQEQNYCKSNYKQVLKPSNNCKQTLFVEER